MRLRIPNNHTGRASTDLTLSKKPKTHTEPGVPKRLKRPTVQTLRREAHTKRHQRSFHLEPSRPQGNLRSEGDRQRDATIIPRVTTIDHHAADFASAGVLATATPRGPHGAPLGSSPTLFSSIDDISALRSIVCVALALVSFFAPLSVAVSAHDGDASQQPAVLFSRVPTDRWSCCRSCGGFSGAVVRSVARFSGTGE